MNDKIIIRQLGLYRIGEIISFHFLIAIILPFSLFMITDNLEILDDFRGSVIILIIVILFLSLIIAIRTYIKEVWVIENDVIYQYRTTLGFGMKTTKVSLRVIRNIDIRNWSYLMGLWPLRELRIDFRSPDGSHGCVEIYVWRRRAMNLQNFFKEYAEAVKNNRWFDAKENFPK